MVVRGGYGCRWRSGSWFVIEFKACSDKNKERVRIQGVHSVLDYTGSCSKMSRKKIFFNEKMVTMTSQF